MRKSRFSEEQIIGILKRVEQGQSVAEICREVGVSVTGSFDRAADLINPLASSAQLG